MSFFLDRHFIRNTIPLSYLKVTKLSSPLYVAPIPLTSKMIPYITATGIRLDYIGSCIGRAQNETLPRRRV